VASVNYEVSVILLLEAQVESLAKLEYLVFLVSVSRARTHKGVFCKLLRSCVGFQHVRQKLLL